ncbi:MAG: cytochrome b/b6 domain-containing protein [Eggerthellaceae bacterium]|nr:cytochrome b/b6 domain-containing protein [Eggerthellaceae bacterium]
MARYIQRHSLQTRITHAVVALSCIWLMISGTFVFVPKLAQIAGGDVMHFMRASHRIVGSILIIVPLVSAISAPQGFKRFVAKYTYKWDKDDKEWMLKFVPYMLGPKRVHMPDQKEEKSGQVVADGALIIGVILMALSGAGLWIAIDLAAAPALIQVLRLVHDIVFILLVVFAIAHIYLGAGVFQPYRGTKRLMWGDGMVEESDALYHWGKWAREEIEKGNVVELPEGVSKSDAKRAIAKFQRDARREAKAEQLKKKAGRKF